MFSSSICTVVLLAVASVNGSPTQYDKRDPQSFALPNRLPVSGNFNGFNITTGATGNSVINFGNGRNSFPFGLFGGLGGNINGGTTNTTTNSRPFPFNLLPFKRDEVNELAARDPQFQFNFPNRLPISGNFGGFNITTGRNGNSVLNFGGGGNSPFSFLGGNRNATSGNRPFPFNFLPFKRDEEHELAARDPQFSFNFPNRLPVAGRLPFGFNIGQGADGNSIANFGNATTGDRGFPFSLLPFKRDEAELEARKEIEARDPQFSFNFPNRLPVSGNLPFGFNIGQGADGNSIANFGNATTGDRGFPFNFLPFKREDSQQ